MNKTPDHLGGHLNRTNTDEPLLRYVKEKRFKVESMLDIGCGPIGSSGRKPNLIQTIIGYIFLQRVLKIQYTILDQKSFVNE